MLLTGATRISSLEFSQVWDKQTKKIKGAVYVHLIWTWKVEERGGGPLFPYYFRECRRRKPFPNYLCLGVRFGHFSSGWYLLALETPMFAPLNLSEDMFPRVAFQSKASNPGIQTSWKWKPFVECQFHSSSWPAHLVSVYSCHKQEVWQKCSASVANSCRVVSFVEAVRINCT